MRLPVPELRLPPCQPRADRPEEIICPPVPDTEAVACLTVLDIVAQHCIFSRRAAAGSGDYSRFEGVGQLLGAQMNLHHTGTPPA